MIKTSLTRDTHETTCRCGNQLMLATETKRCKIALDPGQTFKIQCNTCQQLHVIAAIPAQKPPQKFKLHGGDIPESDPNDDTQEST